MAHAIITKFVNPTASRSSRVKVTSFLNSAMYHWDAGLSVEENHAVAVGHYLYELNKERTGDLKWAIVSGGEMPDTSGYAFIIDLK
ncbi:hypothetical protein Kassivere_00107 [Pseudomonas phage vB_PpuM-Kassivere]